MKKFKVKIGYEACYEIEANNEVAAEEKAWDLFFQAEPHEPIAALIEITEKKK